MQALLHVDSDDVGRKLVAQMKAQHDFWTAMGLKRIDELRTKDVQADGALDDTASASRSENRSTLPARAQLLKEARTREQAKLGRVLIQKHIRLEQRCELSAQV